MENEEQEEAEDEEWIICLCSVLNESALSDEFWPFGVSNTFA